MIFLDEATIRVWRACDSELQAQTDLSDDDYGVLVLLSEAPDRSARMIDLATFLDTSPSRVTYRVDRLVEKGFDRELLLCFERVLMLYECGEVVDIYHVKTPDPVFKCRVRELNPGRPERPIVELIECYTDPGKEVAGKVLNLRFSVAHIPPTAVALAKAIQSGDASCLDERLWPVEAT